MSSNGQISIIGSISDSGIQTRVLDVVQNLTNGLLANTPITLASGDNTINIPVGSTWCIILLPTANAVVTKVKSATGEVGFNVAPAGGWFLWNITTASPPTTFVINSASLQTAVTNILFF